MPFKSNVVRFLVGLQIVLLILSGGLASPPLLLAPSCCLGQKPIEVTHELLVWSLGKQLLYHLDVRCGPQAFVFVFLQELNLLFCAGNHPPFSFGLFYVYKLPSLQVKFPCYHKKKHSQSYLWHLKDEKCWEEVKIFVFFPIYIWQRG